MNLNMLAIVLLQNSINKVLLAQNEQSLSVMVNKTKTTFTFVDFSDRHNGCNIYYVQLYKTVPNNYIVSNFIKQNQYS